MGRDPKIGQPPIKLSREITDALGGQGGDDYKRFKTMSVTTFLSLRRNANLILNMFALMANSKIPGIALEEEGKAVIKVRRNVNLLLDIVLQNW